MAATAGQVAEAGRIPGERIATTEETSDSSTFTTSETVVATVAASLVSGRTYRVRFVGSFESDTGGERLVVRIREDNVSGDTVQRSNLSITATSSLGWPVVLEGEYTAASTGNKTFVATGLRASGSGTINLAAAAGQSAFLYVDYLRN